MVCPITSGPEAYAAHVFAWSQEKPTRPPAKRWSSTSRHFRTSDRSLTRSRRIVTVASAAPTRCTGLPLPPTASARSRIGVWYTSEIGRPKLTTVSGPLSSL